jgi:iron complex transport system ATP-binding protein
MKFLEVNNLDCGYPKSFHLKGVNFSVEKGSFAGIIGPNGSGKSTTLKGITGEIKYKENQIILNNKDLSKISDIERAKKIAIVTQFTESIEISVEDYVLLGRLPYRGRFQFFDTKQDINIATKYMKLTGVYEKRHKMFSELSGGEQQLVSLAKALTQEPELLLLDEPTSHLDISHQVQVLDLAQKLSQELQLTLVMVIHDLNLASEYCDHLVLMKDGKIFTEGTPNEILNYKNIEDVYNTLVVTQKNPLSKKPAIFLVSQNSKTKV